MITFRMKAAQGGEVWVLNHRLTLKSNWTHSVRSINLLTFLANVYDTDLGMALENKLAAVKRTHGDFVSCTTAIGEVKPDPFIREYNIEQDFLCSLDCHLHAIYSALEVASELNRLINNDLQLPKGFRKQSGKYEPFSFEENQWLKELYDIRTELTHYNTVLPLRREGKLIIDFRNSRKMEKFSKGREEIILNNVVNFWPYLLDFLDNWACSLLEKIPQDKEIAIIEVPAFGERPKMKPIKVADIKKFFLKLFV